MKFAALGNLPDKLGTWPWPLKALTALLSGALIVAAQPPFYVLPALFFGFSVFYLLLCTLDKARDGFIYGWLFGFGYFGCGLSWIANALLVDGNEFKWVWPLAVAGLPALLAFFTAAACSLSVGLANLHRGPGFILFLALLMGAEWLRGHIFTGFPWSLYGYVWGASLQIAQLAAIGGIFFLSLLTLVWGTLPGFLMVWGGRRRIATALLLVAFSLGSSYIYGQKRLDANPTILREKIVIRLIQPNIAQADKWNPEKADENFKTLVDLSMAEDINQSLKTIIVWPETALSQSYVARSGPIAQLAMEELMKSYRAPVYLVTGMSRYERDADNDKPRYFNSLVAFDGNLEMISAYDKSHLVPFGEYIPLQEFLPLTPFVQYESFTPGNGPETVTLPGIGTYSPLVCYEVIFPGAVTAAQLPPDFIVNVTNDAWYGDSAGPYQHFVKTQFRAIEEGIPVVRAANTGISGVIDPVGRVLVKQPLFESAGVNVNLPAKLPAEPWYRLWRDWLFLAILGIMIAFAFYARGNGHFAK